MNLSVRVVGGCDPCNIAGVLNSSEVMCGRAALCVGESASFISRSTGTALAHKARNLVKVTACRVSVFDHRINPAGSARIHNRGDEVRERRVLSFEENGMSDCSG